MKLPNALGHVLFGLLLGVPVALVTTPFVGWIAQSFYFLGRERRDRENSLIALDPHTDWYKGWDVWNWKADNRVDLLAPVLVNGVIAAVAWWLLR